MPRTPRLDYPGAVHHAYNRGACHAPVFLDDEDREAFVRLLGLLPNRFGIAVLHYALMTTHFHLVLQARRGNLSRAMQFLMSTYVRHFNGKYGRDGSPFRGRFANQLVETEEYLRTLFGYVSANPVRAKMVADAADWPWSGHAAAVGRAVRPPWLDLSWVEEQFGGPLAFDGFTAEQAAAPEEPIEPPRSTDVGGEPPDLVVGTTPVGRALAIAARTAGVRPHQARKVKGRAGELVTWSLCVHAGLNQREAAAILRISRPAVTQRLQRFEAWCRVDERGRAWRSRLARALS